MSEHKKVDIKDFIPGVRIIIPDAPTSLLIFYIRQALIEFCEFTQYWVEDLDPIKIISPYTEYQLCEPSKGLAVVEIKKASLKLSGDVTTLTKENGFAGRWKFWQDQPGYVIFNPVDEMAGGIVTFRAAVKPAEDGLKISESVYKDYRSCIVAGACAQMLGMQDKKWHNPQKSQAELSKFEAGKIDGMLKAKRGFSASVLRPASKSRDYF